MLYFDCELYNMMMIVVNDVYWFLIVLIEEKILLSNCLYCVNVCKLVSVRKKKRVVT
jgi:hypothetical protein